MEITIVTTKNDLYRLKKVVKDQLVYCIIDNNLYHLKNISKSKTSVGWEQVNSSIQVIQEDTNNIEITFETVSKNLTGKPYVPTYDGNDDIIYITYDIGNGLSIIKTFNYTLDVLTSITLSGSTPSGINLTKTFHYTGENLTSITYS